MGDDEVVILKDGVKRLIRLPFDLCLNRQTARLLREQLLRADHDEFYHGWITIREKEPDQRGANVPVLEWK